MAAIKLIDIYLTFVCYEMRSCVLRMEPLWGSHKSFVVVDRIVFIKRKILSIFIKLSEIV